MKVGACAENVFDIWQRTADRKSTQMVFCDLSTPHGDGKFNVYDDLRNKLIAKGVPAEETPSPTRTASLRCLCRAVR